MKEKMLIKLERDRLSSRLGGASGRDPVFLDPEP